MTIRGFRALEDYRRRAMVAVQVAVCGVLIVGFVALTVDIGTMYNVRADLQRSADAAALAGAVAYTSDTMLRIRQGGDGVSLMYQVVNLARNEVDNFAALNPSLGVDTTSIEAGDLGAGWIDVTSSTDPLQPGVSPDTFNAVQVVARRSSEGLNGGIPLLFARVFGYSTSQTWASAVAVLDDRVGGFDVGEFEGPGYLWPFTLHEDVFEEYLTTGPDDYGFDANNSTVTSSSDGIREIKLYPHDPAPGNFGLLNIGTPNQGVPTLHEHIQDGVPPEAVESEIGTTMLTFYDEHGDSTSYEITGSPGLDASLQPSIEMRIGDVIAFLLHNVVVENGSNSIYTITDIRFARVMDIRLQGASFMRGLWIQPVSYAGPGIIINPEAPSTAGLTGRIVLVR